MCVHLCWDSFKLRTSGKKEVDDAHTAQRGMMGLSTGYDGRSGARTDLIVRRKRNEGDGFGRRAGGRRNIANFEGRERRREEGKNELN